MPTDRVWERGISVWAPGPKLTVRCGLRVLVKKNEKKEKCPCVGVRAA